MSDETLRKCPFCGSGAVHWALVDGWWNACCHACDTRTGRYDTQEAATAAWNRRVPGAGVPVEAIRELYNYAAWYGYTPSGEGSQAIEAWLARETAAEQHAQEDSHE